MTISAAGGADRSQSGAVPPHRFTQPASPDEAPAASPAAAAIAPALSGLARRADTVTIDGKTWDVAAHAGQWTIATQTDPTDPGATEPGAVSRYRIVNLGPDGGQRYYAIASGEKFSEPMLHPEPEKALPVPANVAYVQGTTGESMQLPEDEKIAGIILRDGERRTIGRYSLTNAESQNIRLELDDDGRLKVNGEVFYLQSILVPDANRIRNYDAYFGPKPPDQGKVKVWEKGYLPI